MNQRNFTLEDQKAFAKLSGDYNPLHVDGLAARRYMFGQPVVHGIHAVLWALDNWLAEYTKPLEVRSIKAKFCRPIPLGEEVHYFLKSEEPDHVEIELRCGGSVSTQIYIGKQSADLSSLVSSSAPNSFVRGFPERHTPRDMSASEIETDSGVLELYVDPASAFALFPHLTSKSRPLQIAVMLATTRLVGMRCPGLWSLFSELDLVTIGARDGSQMRYDVTRLDRRFGMVLLNVTAPGITGKIKAFIRPTPQNQATFLELKEHTNTSEFVGQRALIIGGSRGLGEVTTKLLTAGGASVKLTFFQGSDDARRIVDEIVSNGGDAHCFHFDVLNPTEYHPSSLGDWVPTHLYYFATPFIFSGIKGVFESERFRKFCDYYVIGFVKTVDCLGGRGLQHIFYPSSSAIDELPLDLGEYASAKAAGEMLCAFLVRSGRKYAIYRPRLPRMATDQTVSLFPVINQDAGPMLIRHLRLFRDSSVGC